jgi:flavodoxin
MLSKQRLTDEMKVDDVVQVVNDVFGLPATSATTSYLSSVSRVRYFKRGALDEEHDVRRLGKIRCERKTAYIVCRESNLHSLIPGKIFISVEYTNGLVWWKSVAKILVLYYSRTGNTEKMAQAVAEGARAVQGVEVELNYYVPPESLGDFGAILVGAATYHHDMPVSFKSFFEEVAVKNVGLKGKIGAAFGSYGWSGEAPRLVIEIMKNKFEMTVNEPPLSIRYQPDQTGLDKCRVLGKKVAESLMHTA